MVTTPPAIARLMEACIENCTRCHRICLEVAAEHFRGLGPKLEESLVRLLLDCAEICQTSANFMIRGSELHGHICAACAVVCERCAEECWKLRSDPHLAVCAEACDTCAKSCSEMARLVVV
jgi:hypothetical protein